jgi:hypothetical protein
MVTPDLSASLIGSDEGNPSLTIVEKVTGRFNLAGAFQYGNWSQTESIQRFGGSEGAVSVT